MSGSVSVFPIAPDGSLQDSCCFPPAPWFQRASAPANRPARTFARLYAGSALCARSRSWPGPADGLYARERKRQALPRARPVFSNAPGAGPRHCVFHPNGKICYLINELGSSITALRYDAAQGSFSAVQTVPSVVVPFDPESNICACIKMTPDGRFLYGSNRGQDTLVAYAVDPRRHAHLHRYFLQRRQDSPRF